MFKPELWQSHDEYRTIVYTYDRRLSRNNPRYSFDLYDKERQKLLGLNLDAVLDYITGSYSDWGRPAKNQAQILRSLILFVLLFNKTPAKTSLTLWVTEVLPNSTISLTVLIGCTVTCRDIVSDIMARFPASDNPEAALQTIFTLLAVTPSVRLGLIDAKDLTLSGDDTAVVSHSSPLWQASFFLY